MSWPFNHELIRASAGTGKTHQLTSRYIALLHRGVAGEKILASTFTRKAAGEILDRVMSRLARAAVDDQACARLAKSVRDPAFDRAQAVRLVGLLARSMHRLRVCTLDSLFSSMSLSFALELALPPAWSIADDAVDRRMRQQAIRHVLDEHRVEEMLALLRLINRDFAPRQVSRTLEQKIDELYGLWCESDRQAWFAIERQPTLSAEELARWRDHVDQAPLPRTRKGEVNQKWAKSHQAICHAAASADWRAILEAGITHVIASGGTQYAQAKITPEAVEFYRPLVEHARAMMLNDAALEVQALWTLLARFDQAYGAIKTRQGLLRFEDVTRRLAEHESTGDSAELYYRLDAAIEHLLLDEFQDTSLTQWRVIRPMAREIASDASRDRSSFYVGDVKQAIYGWRGGEAEVFDLLATVAPGIETRRLEESHRSVQQVIDCVNQVFTSLPGLSLHSDSTTQAAAKWSAQFQPHHTARLDKTGHCRLMVAPVPEGESPEFAALRAGARLVKQLARDAPGRSIGVLVRKNSQGQIARLIHQIGQDEPGLPGVRASQEGGNPLIDSPAVRMALSAIRLADHPGDDPARYHVAHSPLGESLRLADHADDAASLAAASRIRAMLLEEGYGPTLRRWAAALAPRCDAHDLSRLMQLVELGYEYDADATLRPADFVDFVESRKVEDPTSSQVRVMTIHASKGLQFDAVVLPQLSAVPLIGRPPVVCQLKDPKTREVRQVTRWMNKDVLQCMPELRDRQSEHERQVIRESYCALYVALTRAAEALYMIVEPDRPGQRIQTFGKLLIEALGDGRPAEQGTTLYDNGQEDWWAPRRDVSTPDDPRWTELPTPKLAESPRRTRMLPRWSPSQAERQGKVDLALRLRLGGAGSRRRGTMMHAMLECVRWLDDAPPGRAELLAALRRAGGEGEEAALIEEFDRTLRQPSIAAALSRAAYPADARLELAIEEPFVLREQDAILSGKIDRLVRVHREGRLVGAEVIDYKTDAIGEGGAEAIVEEYRPQIQAYRQAVARMHGLPVQNVTAKLLLIEAGLAVEI